MAHRHHSCSHGGCAFCQGSHHPPRSRYGPWFLISRTGMADWTVRRCALSSLLSQEFCIVFHRTTSGVDADSAWNPCWRCSVARTTGFGVGMWMEHKGQFLSVSCCSFFFFFFKKKKALHFTIRVGWLRLLPPPRELCCGLVATVARAVRCPFQLYV